MYGSLSITPKESITSPKPKMRGLLCNLCNISPSKIAPLSSPGTAGTQEGAITYTSP